MTNWTLIQLPRIKDHRGNLTFVEENRHVPFTIQRVYFLYDVPGGESRGAHAHKALHQVVIAISGSFDVVLYDGQKEERFTLNRAYEGLHIRPGTWRIIDNFSSGAVCLVLASLPYSENDYIRDLKEFESYVGNNRS